jgi:hypothetical protein
MNDNVGEMPLEIFGDYVSDCLDMDFPWVYMVPLIYDLAEPKSENSEVTGFRRISIPLVRRIFPQLIANICLLIM